MSLPIAQAKEGLEGFNLGAGAGFEEGSAVRPKELPTMLISFTVDDTEYNIFNTDMATGSSAHHLTASASVPQRKALIYFSAAMDRTGIEI